MSNPLLIYAFILVSTALLWPGTAAGAEREEQSAQASAEIADTSNSDGDDAKSDQDSPDGVERFLLWSDKPHRNMSNRLENLSQSMDSIFGEERIYQEATKSYLQIRGGIIIERGGSLSLDHKLRLKIDLPRTEERVKLVFESEDDDQDVLDSESDGSSDTDNLRGPGDKDYSAALQFFIRESNRWNISLGPGVRVRAPPDPFARVRIRRTQRLGSTWQTHLTERLTGYLQRGLESRTTLEFERRTGKDQLFRLSSQVLWREEFSDDNAQLSQSAQLYKRLTNRDSIAYGAAVVWETKPNLHHEVYIADIRWRRRIHKKWLFLEVKPEVRFERDDHFKLDPSLTVSLEVLFGKPYL